MACLLCNTHSCLTMSLASIVHAHSYNLEAQVADGVFQSKTLGKRRAEPADTSGGAASSLKSSKAEAAASSKWTPPTSASFYIPSLPGLDPESSLTLYGGHLPSTVTSDTPAAEVAQQQSGEATGGGDAHLFFFLAKAKHIAAREKLVVWLNGGEAQLYRLDHASTPSRRQGIGVSGFWYQPRRSMCLANVLHSEPYIPNMPSSAICISTST